MRTSLTYTKHDFFGETSFGSYAKKRYQYTGKERDEESGLYYYGARYYAAWTCRFTSTDPLAAEYPNVSAYAYAFNNPLAFNDPTGMEGESASADNIGGGDVGNTDGGGNKEGAQQHADKHQSETGETSSTDPKDVYTFPEVEIVSESAVTGSSNDGGAVNKDVPLGENSFNFSYPENSSLDSPTAESSTPMEKMEPIEPKEIPNDAGEQSLKQTPPTGESANTEGNNFNYNKGRLMFDGFDAFIDKTKQIFKHIGKDAAKVIKFLTKVGKGLAVVGLILAGIDVFFNFNENGYNWKTYTKAVIGTTIALLALTAVPVTAIGLLYGIADYYGVIDNALNTIEKSVNDIIYKTNKAMYDIRQGINYKGWYPGKF